MLQTRSRVAQITISLRRLIAAGAFAENRLPSEPELAQRLGASRTTVREALAKLELDGILVRKHGVGTFINERILNIGTRLEEVSDFAEMIRLSGFAPTVSHRELSLGRPSKDILEKLALEPGEEVLTTANVFFADDIPVIYCTDTIPANLIRSAYRDEELHGPVYTFLDQRCKQSVAYNLTEVVPVVADTQLSDLLDCPSGNPLHRFIEIAFNADDAPIMFSDEYYRPDYFTFNVVRKWTSLRPVGDTHP